MELQQKGQIYEKGVQKGSHFVEGKWITITIALACCTLVSILFI
jgi:hypothetical protein